MKVFFFLISIFLFPKLSIQIFSQNLITNPSFEEINYCPDTLHTIQSWPLHTYTTPKNWYRVTKGTPDHFHTCSVGTEVYAPDNLWGYQAPRTGDSYAGIFFYTYTKSFTYIDYKEYLMTKLSSPLVAGNKYVIEFYVSLAEGKYYHCFATNKIGIHFSNTPVSEPLNNTVISVSPQVTYTSDSFLSDTINWTKIICSYIAEGGEEYMIIGCFEEDAIMSVKSIKSSTNPAQNIYYYFDDFCVIGLTGEPDEKNSYILNYCSDNLTKDYSENELLIWHDGDTSHIRTLDSVGTYWVKYIEECRLIIDTIIVSDRELKEPIVEDIIICSNTGKYTPSAEGVGLLWYESPTDSTPQLVPDDIYLSIPDTYIYYVESHDGTCYSDRVSFKIIVLASPYLELGNDTLVCFGDTLRLNSNFPSTDYLWSNGDTTSTIEITESGTYFLTQNFEHCGGRSDTIDVYFINCDNDCLLFPNAFSPNNDGLNDVFQAVNRCGDVRRFSLFIFNRYGQEVFRSFNINDTWDGTYKNKPCDIGVYFYYSKIRNPKTDEDFFYKGDVTIIR